MRVDQFSDEEETTFDAGDLGTAWLPYSEPRAQDLEALAIALIQHAKTMPRDNRPSMPVVEALAAALLNLHMHAETITQCGEMPKTWGHEVGKQ
jgi:hypothetical protein